MGSVYLIENIKNNNKYIGMTSHDNYLKRIAQHVADSKRWDYQLCRAIRKYGWGNFTHRVLFKSDNIEDLKRYEVVAISEHDTYRNGYNMTIGGDGYTGKLSKDIKTKISKSMRGRKLSTEHKQRISAAMRGRKRKPFSKEHRRRLSEAETGTKHWKARTIILIHPDGVEERFDCMRDACRKYGLSSGCLTALAKNKRNHHKGFKCRYLEG